MGQKHTMDDVKKMIAGVDIDKNGKIEFEEFLEMMASGVTSVTTMEGPLLQAFKQFDKDGNGFIDASELKKTMRELGQNLTDDEIESMMKEADTNGDGKIDYQEFLKMMK